MIIVNTSPISGTVHTLCMFIYISLELYSHIPQVNYKAVK